VTALLAAIFALPSCFTAMVWSSGGGTYVANRGDHEATSVFVVPANGARPVSLLVHVPPNSRQDVITMMPGVAAEASWLLIEAIDDADSLARVIDFGAQAHPSVCVVDLPDAAPRIEVRCWFSAPVTEADSGVRLPIACRVRGLTERPAVVEPASFGTLVIAHESVVSEGTPVVVRVLLTVPAAALDLVLLPFELIAALVFLPKFG
jgi:hypothetical protein